MTMNLTAFQDSAFDEDFLRYLIDQQAPVNRRRYGRLWDYFRNPRLPAPPDDSLSQRGYQQAQEEGLPPRIVGTDAHGRNVTDVARKEVVIENDIAWRIETMIDFLFGKPVVLRSLAQDPTLARAIESVLSAMLEANGGMAFLQDVALFGSVYGFVDVALRTPADGPDPLWTDLPRRAGNLARGENEAGADRRSGTPEDSAPCRSPSPAALQRARRMAAAISLEAIEAPRVVPILAEDDCRRVRYWVQAYRKQANRIAGSARRWLRLPWFGRGGASPEEVEVVEILGPTWWQRYEDGHLLAEGLNPLGVVPIVHVQNLRLPGSYAGASDVEPLLALQDELNTRLSDRANRITYQSFKMYLGRGIEDFLERPVGPGQMWATHNPDASVQEFGSDSGSPSEDAHILQVREALDKVSGVTPLAAGLVRGNVGHLTSATALKVVLSGILSRTARKRLTYGAGIARLAELALAWLHVTGALPTRPSDRRVEVNWTSPLPVDEDQQLRMAQAKLQLGVDRNRVLAELGYEPHPD